MEEEQTFNRAPSAELSLTLEQASIILKTHEIGGSYVKLDCINRGFNNKTYFVTPVQGPVLVIRVTGKCAAWKKVKTENEVASIKYLKKHTKLPVPEIYGFSFDPETSPVGYEYILMEKLDGIPLDELFEKLELPEKKQVLKNVVEVFGGRFGTR